VGTLALCPAGVLITESNGGDAGWDESRSAPLARTAEFVETDQSDLPDGQISDLRSAHEKRIGFDDRCPRDCGTGLGGGEHHKAREACVYGPDRNHQFVLAESFG